MHKTRSLRRINKSCAPTQRRTNRVRPTQHHHTLITATLPLSIQKRSFIQSNPKTLTKYNISRQIGKQGPYKISKRYYDDVDGLKANPRRKVFDPDKYMGPPRSSGTFTKAQAQQRGEEGYDGDDDLTEYSDGNEVPPFDPHLKKTLQMPPLEGKTIHEGETIFLGPQCSDVFVTLHSTLGDRPWFLRSALEEIAKLPETTVTGVSPMYATPSKRPKSNGAKFTLAVRLTTTIVPRSLVLEFDRIQLRFGKHQGNSHELPLSKYKYPINIDLISYGSLLLDEYNQNQKNGKTAGKVFQDDVFTLEIPHRTMASVEVSYALASLIAVNPTPCMGSYGTCIKYNDLWHPRDNLSLTHYLSFPRNAKPIYPVTPIFNHKNFDSFNFTNLLQSGDFSHALRPEILDLYQFPSLTIRSHLPQWKTTYNPYSPADTAHRTRVLPPNTLTMASIPTWEHPYISKFRNYNHALIADEKTIKDVISLDDSNGFTKRPFIRIGTDIYNALTLELVPKPSHGGIDYINPDHNIDITLLVPFPLTFLSFPLNARVAITQALSQIAQGTNIISVSAHTLDSAVDINRDAEEQIYSSNDVLWFLRQCIDYYEHLKFFDPVDYDDLDGSNQRRRQNELDLMQKFYEFEISIGSKKDVYTESGMKAKLTDFDYFKKLQGNLRPEVRVHTQRWEDAMEQYQRFQLEYVEDVEAMKRHEAQNSNSPLYNKKFNNKTGQTEVFQAIGQDGKPITDPRVLDNPRYVTSRTVDKYRERMKASHLQFLDNRSQSDRYHLTRVIQRAFAWDLSNPLYISDRDPAYKELGLDQIDDLEKYRGTKWQQDEFNEWEHYFNLTTTPTRNLRQKMSTAGTNKRDPNQTFQHILTGVVDPHDGIRTNHHTGKIQVSPHMENMNVGEFTGEHNYHTDHNMQMTKDSPYRQERQFKEDTISDRISDTIRKYGTSQIGTQHDIQKDNKFLWADESIRDNDLVRFELYRREISQQIVAYKQSLGLELDPNNPYERLDDNKQLLPFTNEELEQEWVHSDLDFDEYQTGKSTMPSILNREKSPMIGGRDVQSPTMKTFLTDKKEKPSFLPQPALPTPSGGYSEGLPLLAPPEPPQIDLNGLGENERKVMIQFQKQYQQYRNHMDQYQQAITHSNQLLNGGPQHGQLLIGADEHAGNGHPLQVQSVSQNTLPYAPGHVFPPPDLIKPRHANVKSDKMNLAQLKEFVNDQMPQNQLFSPQKQHPQLLPNYDQTGGSLMTQNTNLVVNRSEMSRGVLPPTPTSTQGQYQAYLQETQKLEAGRDILLYGENLELTQTSWSSNFNPKALLGKFTGMINEYNEKNQKESLEKYQKSNRQKLNQVEKDQSQTTSPLTQSTLQEEFDQQGKDNMDRRIEAFFTPTPTMEPTVGPAKPSPQTPHRPSNNSNTPTPTPTSPPKRTEIRIQSDFKPVAGRQFQSANFDTARELERNVLNPSAVQDSSLREHIFPTELELSEIRRFGTQLSPTDRQALVDGYKNRHGDDDISVPVPNDNSATILQRNMKPEMVSAEPNKRQPNRLYFGQDVSNRPQQQEQQQQQRPIQAGSFSGDPDDFSEQEYKPGQINNPQKVSPRTQQLLSQLSSNNSFLEPTPTFEGLPQPNDQRSSPLRQSKHIPSQHNQYSPSGPPGSGYERTGPGFDRYGRSPNQAGNTSRTEPSNPGANYDQTQQKPTRMTPRERLAELKRQKTNYDDRDERMSEMLASSHLSSKHSPSQKRKPSSQFSNFELDDLDSKPSRVSRNLDVNNTNSGFKRTGSFRALHRPGHKGEFNPQPLPQEESDQLQSDQLHSDQFQSIQDILDDQLLHMNDPGYGDYPVVFTPLNPIPEVGYDYHYNGPIGPKPVIQMDPETGAKLSTEPKTIYPQNDSDPILQTGHVFYMDQSGQSINPPAPPTFDEMTGEAFMKPSIRESPIFNEKLAKQEELFMKYMREYEELDETYEMLEHKRRLDPKFEDQLQHEARDLLVAKTKMAKQSPRSSGYYSSHYEPPLPLLSPEESIAFQKDMEEFRQFKNKGDERRSDPFGDLAQEAKTSAHARAVLGKQDDGQQHDKIAGAKINKLNEQNANKSKTEKSSTGPSDGDFSRFLQRHKQIQEMDPDDLRQKMVVLQELNEKAAQSAEFSAQKRADLYTKEPTFEEYTSPIILNYPKYNKTPDGFDFDAFLASNNFTGGDNPHAASNNANQTQSQKLETKPAEFDPFKLSPLIGSKLVKKPDDDILGLYKASSKLGVKRGENFSMGSTLNKPEIEIQPVTQSGPQKDFSYTPLPEKTENTKKEWKPAGILEAEQVSMDIINSGITEEINSIYQTSVQQKIQDDLEDQLLRDFVHKDRNSASTKDAITIQNEKNQQFASNQNGQIEKDSNFSEFDDDDDDNNHEEEEYVPDAEFVTPEAIKLLEKMKVTNREGITRESVEAVMKFKQAVDLAFEESKVENYANIPHDLTLAQRHAYASPEIQQKYPLPPIVQENTPKQRFYHNVQVPLSHLYPKLQFHITQSAPGTPLLCVHTSNAEAMLRGVLSGADMIHDFGFGGQDERSFNIQRVLDVPVIVGHMRGNISNFNSEEVLSTYSYGHQSVQDVKNNDLYSSNARRGGSITANNPIVSNNDLESMYNNPFYSGIAFDIEQYLHHSSKSGVAMYNTIIDPGIGLSKTSQINLSLPSNLTSLLPPALPLPMMISTTQLPSITRLLHTTELTLSQNLADISKKQQSNMQRTLRQLEGSKQDQDHGDITAHQDENGIDFLDAKIKKRILKSVTVKSDAYLSLQFSPNKTPQVIQNPLQYGPHGYRQYDPWTYKHKISQELHGLVSHLKYTYKNEQYLLETVVSSNALYSVPQNALQTQIDMYSGTSSRLAIVQTNTPREVRLGIELTNITSGLDSVVKSDNIRM
jgi:7,8-dihydro-6-hydroxymethylpterin-pyrophosphokinase/dihydropteroate synthase